MVNKNYQKGRAFEYKIKKAYEKSGYLVFRSAGSHSIADLIAIHPSGLVHLIQCKATSFEKIDKKEIETLKRIANMYNTKPVIAYKHTKKVTYFIILNEDE